jgi:hypothetical protein
MKNLFKFLSLLTVSGLILASCEGPQGLTGADGQDGIDGVDANET